MERCQEMDSKRVTYEELQMLLYTRTEELALARQRIEVITKSIDAAVISCALSGDFRIFYASDIFFHLLDYTRDEFAQIHGDSIALALYPISKREIENSMKSAKKRRTSVDDSVVLFKKDGSKIWLRARGEIAVKEDGTPVFHGTLTDITMNQEKNIQLLISKKRYEIALSQTGLTLFEYNILTREFLFYDDTENIYGVSSSVANGPESFMEAGIVMPESLAVFRELYRRIHGGSPFEKCLIYSRKKNGGVAPVEISLFTVFDEKNNPVYAIGVRKDISDIHQLQREEKFSQTLAAGKRLVCEADITRDVLVHVNPQWLEEIGVDRWDSFSELIHVACQNVVAPEHRAMILEKIKPENIIAAYKRGENLLMFQYRRENEALKSTWYEITINIIEDSSIGDISIRYYMENIDARKKKEQKAQEERLLYETMAAKAIMACEVNITRDVTESGHEAWEALYGICVGSSYRDMLEKFAQKVIHPEDRERFLSAFKRAKLLEAYQQGERGAVCQYRIQNLKGTYVWVSCTIHLYEDPENSDIKGYSYVEDIDEQKKVELMLKHNAEHDGLTGFYNKATVEYHISAHLSRAENKKHALLMVDIDYFKSINDTFGHAFGDVVLAQTASKISKLFRTGDILGRIGGDEFIIFMKDIASQEIAINKAEEICTTVFEHYYHGGQEYHISASVGIAICDDHGKTYSDLYRHGDSAMYAAKKSGRNQSTLYSTQIEVVDIDAKAIRTSPLVEPKPFEENITEYVFRILYESQDKEAGVNAVLDLLGKHLNAARVYVFESDRTQKSVIKTFEWHDEACERLSATSLVGVDFEGYTSLFNSEGVFHVANAQEEAEALKQLFGSAETILQIAILRNGCFMGFVGMEKKVGTGGFTTKEVAVAYSVARILGVFILEMHATRRSKEMERLALSVIDGIGAHAYVCDPDSFEILFINKRMETICEESGRQVLGGYCYKEFRKRVEPCLDCPIKDLKRGEGMAQIDFKLDHRERWFRANASWIAWKDGRQACLVDCMDITWFKENGGENDEGKTEKYG